MLMEHFVAGTPARSVAELVGVNRKTASLFYHKLREMIAYQLDRVFPEHGEFEADESYFGGMRKGKRGRGAAGRVPVFGILKRGGKVYARIISDAKTKTLMQAIGAKILPDSAVYTDAFSSYDVLDVSEFHHHHVNHSDTLLVWQRTPYKWH